MNEVNVSNGCCEQNRLLVVYILEKNTSSFCQFFMKESDRMRMISKRKNIDLENIH